MRKEDEDMRHNIYIHRDHFDHSGAGNRVILAIT
jgi:hypothetical protein